jgi:methionine biosynthesis protein MetW
MIRADLATIASWIGTGAKVLDLGCGDGTLLRHLMDTQQATGYGIEIDHAKVIASLRNGVDVLQMDLEAGLSGFESGSFDFVVLSLTLQAMHRTEDILREMLRVGREGIVTFPNFGYWRNRWQLVRGRMPVSESLPFQWYDTPNIHLCTIADFENLCTRLGVRILRREVLHNGREVRLMRNLRGSVAMFSLAA